MLQKLNERDDTWHITRAIDCKAKQLEKAAVTT